MLKAQVIQDLRDSTAQVNPVFVIVGSSVRVQLSIKLWNVGFAATAGSVVFTGMYSTTPLGGTRYVMPAATASFPANLAANGVATFTPSFNAPVMQGSNTLYYYLTWY